MKTLPWKRLSCSLAWKVSRVFDSQLCEWINVMGDALHCYLMMQDPKEIIVILLIRRWSKTAGVRKQQWPMNSDRSGYLDSQNTRNNNQSSSEKPWHWVIWEWSQMIWFMKRDGIFIIVRIKPNNTVHYGYSIAPRVHHVHTTYRIALWEQKHLLCFRTPLQHDAVSHSTIWRFSAREWRWGFLYLLLAVEKGVIFIMMERVVQAVDPTHLCRQLQILRDTKRNKMSRTHWWSGSGVLQLEICWSAGSVCLSAP